ncbi:ABC transporter permease [Lysinibacillus sp. LZ02]|uniref:ABC transporter permease n=1 Tax=Lysinibacillus sp. LZ02 TaxID=3420668 RepID=UPI003D3693E2
MKGLLSYQFSSYIRSHKYIPPLSIFIIWLIVNYTYIPNPILDSYSFTSLLLFFMMGWFTVTVFHVEERGQKQITLLHAQSLRKYYLSLFIIATCIGFCLSLVAVAYPIVFGSFGVEARPVHIIMGLLSHFSLSFLAVTLSALFTREIVKSSINTWWGVLSILIVSLVMATLKNTTLLQKGLIWFVPPVHLPLEMMTSGDHIQLIPGLFYWQFGWIFIYGSLFIGVFLFIVQRKRTF